MVDSIPTNCVQAIWKTLCSHRLGSTAHECGKQTQTTAAENNSVVKRRFREQQS